MNGQLTRRVFVIKFVRNPSLKRIFSLVFSFEDAEYDYTAKLLVKPKSLLIIPLLLLLPLVLALPLILW